MRAHRHGLRPRSALRLLPPVSPGRQPDDGGGAGRHLLGPELGHAARVSGALPPPLPPEAPAPVCVPTAAPALCWGSRWMKRTLTASSWGFTPVRRCVSDGPTAVTNSVSQRNMGVGRAMPQPWFATVGTRGGPLQPEPVRRRTMMTIEPVRGMLVLTRARSLLTPPLTGVEEVQRITVLVKHGTSAREQKGSGKFEKRGSKANFSSVFWLVHVLSISNKARGFHV